MWTIAISQNRQGSAKSGAFYIFVFASLSVICPIRPPLDCQVSFCTEATILIEDSEDQKAYTNVGIVFLIIFSDHCGCSSFLQN